MAKQTRPYEDKLSDDAKAILGGLFGMGLLTGVTFQLVESKPTARAQAALDECVRIGALTLTKGEKRVDGSCSATYKATFQASVYLPCASKAKGFTITEPIR